MDFLIPWSYSSDQWAMIFLSFCLRNMTLRLLKDSSKPVGCFLFHSSSFYFILYLLEHIFLRCIIVCEGKTHHSQASLISLPTYAQQRCACFSKDLLFYDVMWWDASLTIYSQFFCVTMNKSDAFCVALNGRIIAGAASFCLARGSTSRDTFAPKSNR